MHVCTGLCNACNAEAALLAYVSQAPLCWQVEKLVDRERAIANGVTAAAPTDARGLLDWALTHRVIDTDALHELVTRVVERFTIEATVGEKPKARLPMSHACRLLHTATPAKDFWGLNNTMQASTTIHTSNMRARTPRTPRANACTDTRRASHSLIVLLSPSDFRFHLETLHVAGVRRRDSHPHRRSPAGGAPTWR